MQEKYIANLKKAYEESGLEIDYTGFDSVEDYLKNIAKKALTAHDNIAKIYTLDDIAENNKNLPLKDLEKLYDEYSEVFFTADIKFD
jgi:hypothetical protein